MDMILGFMFETVKPTELLWMGCAAPTSIVECLFAQVKSKPDLVKSVI